MDHHDGNSPDHTLDEKFKVCWTKWDAHYFAILIRYQLSPTRDSIRFRSLPPTVCLLTSSLVWGAPPATATTTPLDLQILTTAHLCDPRSGATTTMPRVANKAHRRSGGGNSTPQKNAPIRYLRQQYSQATAVARS